MRATILCAALVGIASIVACLDVVHDDQVDALGDEKAGTPEGPLHRPGQTCSVCHGGKGPGSPEFSIAGTVFVSRGSSEGALGITVLLTDANGKSPAYPPVTNNAGNFYVNRSDWDPTYPVNVKLSGPDPDGGIKEHVMVTTMGGDGGCAKCHQNPGDRDHMPGVDFQ